MKWCATTDLVFPTYEHERILNDTATDPHDPPDDDSVQPARFHWWLLIPIILLVPVALIVRSALPSSVVQNSPAVGKPAPELDLVLLSEEQAAEPLQLRPDGNVTLVHFWGTWCGPCRMEYPHLSLMTLDLQEEERFQFVSVSCESSPEETFEGLWSKTKEYFHSTGIPNQTAYADPRGATRMSLLERLERPAVAYPTSILVDDQGKIAGVWEGYSPGAVEQIKLLADQLLAKSGDR